MDHRTPESMGISSASVLRYLRGLEQRHLTVHDIIIARGNSVIFETYVPPFAPEMTHRMYSVTKSFVSLAVGFALDDGLLSLDDPMEKYFAAELEGQTDENLRRQTVRDMLMMATCRTAGNWFRLRTDDRVRAYFQGPSRNPRPAGSYFEYDSSGTFVIGALVERLTGKALGDYLREKLFDPIGISDTVRFLRCPGGHSWSDSAMLMRPRDLLLAARFTLNGGSWEGRQLLSADYVRTAVSRLISTDTGSGRIDDNGYGYYVWKTPGDGFYFNGMGSQYAVCLPDKDLILIHNGDNQGVDDPAREIIGGFLDVVAAEAGAPLPEDPAALAALKDYAAHMTLPTARGGGTSPMAKLIGGQTYELAPNPMGIARLRLDLSEDGTEGSLDYVNAQGEKHLPFGILSNRFGLFPETGYSDLVGSRPGSRLYRCAASAAWETPQALWLRVQIIDDYFGNFDARFTFSDDGKKIAVAMKKHAEDFLDTYNGTAEGFAADGQTVEL